jgi:hypothetical protein
MTWSWLATDMALLGGVGPLVCFKAYLIACNRNLVVFVYFRNRCDFRLNEPLFGVTSTGMLRFCRALKTATAHVDKIGWLFFRETTERPNPKREGYVPQ